MLAESAPQATRKHAIARVDRGRAPAVPTALTEPANARVPRLARHLIGFGLSWLFITFGLKLASAAFDYGTENWPAAVLAGLALAAVLWGVIEALRFGSMRRTATLDTGPRRTTS